MIRRLTGIIVMVAVGTVLVSPCVDLGHALQHHPHHHHVGLAANFEESSIVSFDNHSESALRQILSPAVVGPANCSMRC